MSIRAKLLLCFSGFLTLLLFLAGLGLNSGIKHEEQFRRLYEDHVRGAVYLADCQNALWKLRFGLSQFITADEAARKKIIDEEPGLYQTVHDNLARFQEGNLSEEERSALKDVQDIYKQYIEARPKWFELMMAGKTQEAGEWRAKTTLPFGAQTVKCFTTLIDLQKNEANKALEEATSSAHTTRNLSVAAAIIALLFGAGMLVYITSSISKPLRETADALRDIAEGEGDLTRRLQAGSKDEIGEVARAFNLFVEKIQGTVRNVTAATTQVLGAAEVLHKNADEIAAGANSVSGEAATMAGAVEEMVHTSSEIADNCCRAAESSEKASLAARNGKAVVQETVAGMEQIAQRVKATAQAVEQLGVRSDQIGEIVGTIEDIADQTNLLALNAAIEAARAGEQGRGFAVVADEVRALAERTTKATREIGEMIRSIQGETREAVAAMEEGVREVERGTSEAARSGQALQDILDQISSVSGQVNQIAIAAEEQTATVATLKTGIHGIFENVNVTSDGATGTSSAAGQMTKLALDLELQVRHFAV